MKLLDWIKRLFRREPPLTPEQRREILLKHMEDHIRLLKEMHPQLDEHIREHAEMLKRVDKW